MSIRDWPAAERPRERLLASGAESLSDAELLAIFLRTGVSGKSAVDLARHLLSQFGCLRALLEADQITFSKHMGLGPAKFAQLQAAQEMSRRHLAERAREGRHVFAYFNNDTGGHAPRAMAGKLCIVEVEHIVETGELLPDDVAALVAAFAGRRAAGERGGGDVRRSALVTAGQGGAC
mgnify:CR=1 FL=1